MFFHRFFSSKPVSRRHSYAKLGHPAPTRKRLKSSGDTKTVFRNGEYHLTAPQLKALVSSATTPRDRAILQLFAETGIRRVELASLDVADIVGNQSMLVVRRGKGGKMRMLPLTPSLLRQLAALVIGRSSGSVFTSSGGSRLSVRQINRIVAATGQRAGLSNPNPRHSQITCHLLRHSFSRLWKAHGGSIETLSRILGHASVKTTLDVYGRESWPDVQKNYARTISRITKGKTTQFDQWR